MKVQELTDISVWASNEEVKLLEKLRRPVKLSSLTEHEQFRILAMIRKDLVIKRGDKDPIVVANETCKPI